MLIEHARNVNLKSSFLWLGTLDTGLTILVFRKDFVCPWFSWRMVSLEFRLNSNLVMREDDLILGVLARRGRGRCKSHHQPWYKTQPSLASTAIIRKLSVFLVFFVWRVGWSRVGYHEYSKIFSDTSLNTFAYSVLTLIFMSNKRFLTQPHVSQ